MKACTSSWMLLAVLAFLNASCAARAPMGAALRCPNGHLYENVGEHRVRAFQGVIKIRYPAGDAYPLPDAFVQARAADRKRAVYSMHSREDGSFGFSDAPMGAYEILICKEGFAALEGRVVLSKDATAAEVVLETRLE